MHKSSFCCLRNIPLETNLHPASIIHHHLIFHTVIIQMPMEDGVITSIALLGYHSSSSLIDHPSSIIRRLSSVAYRPSPIIHRLSFIVYCLSSIVHCLSFIVCRLSFIVYRPSFIIHHHRIFHTVMIQIAMDDKR